MIEIISGTLEERIITLLQKTYPITVNDLKKKLNVSHTQIMRTLYKLQTQGVLKLDVLPDTAYIRLMRHDFLFIGKTKQHHTKKQKIQHDNTSAMYQ